MERDLERRRRRSNEQGGSLKDPPRIRDVGLEDQASSTAMISRVRGDVLQTTDQKQVPWDNSSLVGDVYLAGGTPPVAKSDETAPPSTQQKPVVTAQNPSAEAAQAA